MTQNQYIHIKVINNTQNYKMTINKIKHEIIA